VLAAVGRAIGSQYGVRNLVDALGGGDNAARSSLWWAVALLQALIAADNLLSRLRGAVLEMPANGWTFPRAWCARYRVGRA
jgi:ATP-binding cassette, subfamily B, bacterial